MLSSNYSLLRTIATPVTEYRVLPFAVEELDGRLGAGGFVLTHDRLDDLVPGAIVTFEPGPHAALDMHR